MTDREHWTPVEQEQLEQELLELHFGCHEDPSELEQRLAQDPALRELQQRVMSQAELLHDAVRPRQDQLELTPPATTPTMRRPFHHRAGGRLVAAAAAALLTVLGFFAFERIQAVRSSRYLQSHAMLTVSAPKAVPAGAPWSFTVQARDLQEGDAAGELHWRAFTADDEPVAAGDATLQHGRATIALAADLIVPQRVELVLNSNGDEITQSFELDSAEAGPLVHVTTDRPVYRPGEAVLARVVVLDRISQKPIDVDSGIRVRLQNARGIELASDRDPEAPLGVGTFRLPIPDGCSGGVHTVSVESDGGRFAAEATEIVIRAFHEPLLDAEITLDRASYAPGARGAAELRVTRIADDAPAGRALAIAALIVDGTRVWSERQTLSRDGRARFRFEVPRDVRHGDARFVASINDGGTIETAIEPFVVPTGRIEVAAFPEGGALVADVENRVYLECTDPLGRPIDTAGAIIDETEHSVATFRTEHQGRARFRFVPAAGHRYRVRVGGHRETFALPEPVAHGVALQLSGDEIAAGAPLRIDVAGNGNGPWLAAVFCRGVLAGQTTLRPDARGRLQTTAEIELTEAAAGVLRVTVFDHKLQPIAERLVRRLGSRALQIALEAEHDVLSPGERQTLHVTTHDETGEPTPAVVGLACVDRAITTLGLEPRIGLLDQALLFGDVEKIEEIGDFFLASQGSSRNIDLLLGTRGWRRFVWRNDDEAKARIAAAGDAGERILARLGFSQTPQVLTAGATPDQARAVRASAFQARRLLSRAIAFALALVLLALSAESIAWLMRSLRPTSALVQSVFAPLGGALVLTVVASLLIPNLASRRVAFSDAIAPGSVLEFDDAGGSIDWGAEPKPAEQQLRDILTETRAMTAPTGAALQPAGAAATADEPLDVDIETDRDAPDANAALVLEREHAGTPLRINLLLALDESPQAGFLDNRRSARERWLSACYAHRHSASSGNNRRDFTPTIYWNTLLVTGKDGRATATFDTSDAATTWSVHADAHTARIPFVDGAPAPFAPRTTDPRPDGRVGQADASFRTELPLHVEMTLPVEVSAGDQLLLPVSCALRDADADADAELVVRLGYGLQLSSQAPRSISLTRAEGDSSARGRALIPIEVGDAVGTTTIAVAVRHGRFEDRVQRTFEVAPRGFPHRRSAGGSVRADASDDWQLTVPDDAVANSGRVTLKVYPSPIAALTDGLQGILREPHGCFEQASSANYPNTMVLNLIEASGDNVPAAAARARALLPAGYAKITGYECDERGYEWFGNDPGHEALTAYGLLQFADMANVFEVDLAMVGRTRRWLLDRRDGEGNYPHPTTDSHHFGGRNPLVTRAYVTYALLQAGTPADELKVEVDALVPRATASDDPYELALVACATHLAERADVAATARDRLAKMQREDGAVPGADSTITMSGGNDALVETAGFAVLAWLPDARHAASLRRAVEFLQGARNGRGTFGATQATITALRALTAYATATRRMADDGTMRVFEGARLLAERAFTAGSPEALTIDLWHELTPGEHTLRIELTGGGADAVLPWSGDVTYHAELPADDADTSTSLTTTLRDASVERGNTVALDVVMRNLTTEELPTPMATIGLPAGVEVQTRVLEDLKRADRFAFWELDGRQLVLYWRKLDPQQTVDFTLDLVARVPGITTGPASRTWLYYTPERVRWAAPLSIEIFPAR